MRAFQVPAQGQSFALTEREIPVPAAGDVRIKVRASGICRSDVFAIKGLPGAVYPLTPGHEIAGVVDAVGDGVRAWEPGDRVGVGWFGGQCGECISCRRGAFVTCSALKAPGLVIDGGYAEYVVVPATAPARVPNGLDFAHAGPLMCAGVTAFNALRRGQPGAGQRVAVIGLGGVGHLAVQFARKMGCETVAVSRGRGKESVALKLGAHHFIDSQAAGAVEKLRELGGADVIIATAPDNGDVGRFTAAASAHGRIIVTGFSTEPLQVSSVELISRSLSISGSAAGTSMDAEETLRFAELHGIRPVIEEFPFEAASAAYEKMLDSSVHFRAVLNMDLDAAAWPTSSAALDTRESAGSTDGRRGSALVTRHTDPVLDCPYEERPEINELIEAAMRWHFSPATGSPFWLEQAERLDFDPIKDIRTFADLRLFPNVADELRYVPVRDLVPRGYGSEPGICGVFESGGVTGPPKRVVLLKDWLERYLAWDHRRRRNYATGVNFLLVAPSGPHLMTFLLTEAIRRMGGIAFTVDMDPRWVRKCLDNGRGEEAARYIDHLMDQIAIVLETQDVNVLTITPPLLEKLAQNPALVDLVKRKVSVITWGGSHMDADTRQLFRTEVFPGVKLRGGYGNTMVLGGSAERLGLADDDPCVFDPTTPPYITFSVVDPETYSDVAYGERGRVVMNHISKSMLLPNNLERDTAIRVPGLPGQVGDSVADIAPVAKFDGGEVIEGVY